MIELLPHTIKAMGDTPSIFLSPPVSFEQLQAIVGGWVQCVPVRLGDHKVHAISNEDGLALALPVNHLAQARFKGLILMSPAVGNWVILTGEDLLK